MGKETKRTNSHRKNYFNLTKIVNCTIMALLLGACSSSHLVQIPKSPGQFNDLADYRDYDLFVTSFTVNNLEKTTDVIQVDRLKTRFFDYLLAQNRFRYIHDGPRVIGQTNPSLSLTVDIFPSYTSNRTWILDVITFYPFLGLWPITPHWGVTTVRLEAQLFDPFGTLLKRFRITKEYDYSNFLYSVYTSSHVEDSFQECYHLAFNDLSKNLSAYQPLVTAYVDSVHVYRRPIAEQKKEPVGQQASLAVVELDAYGIAKTDAGALSNRLTSEIFKTGRYTVLEREKIEEILLEQGFQQTGCTSSECLVEAGRLLNVQLIVGGSISKIGAIYTVELRLIDVETGKIVSVANEDIQGTIGDVLTKGVRRAAIKLIR